MALTADQFAKAVIHAGLSSADEIKSLWAALPAGTRPKDGETFAKVLVEREKLTQFQAAEILAGSSMPLVLGNYVLLSKIGAGGMGQVFKAQHRHMDRLVAIKLLPAAMAKDTEAVKRFQREVKAAAKLSHPNIVQAHDASVQRGVWYLVMEYVEGHDLAGVVADEGPLPVDRAVNYIQQAAKGLAFAHKSGVVHRDIKPANLLLDKEGTVKILDMGLARIEDGAATAAKEGLTQSGQVMGTIDYMAPEQAFDTRHADARADIYSLGCTLYRLLTGLNLFEGETLVQKLMAHQQQAAPDLSQRRADAPPELNAIFQKMVAKKPEDRFQSMAEVEAALGELLSKPAAGSAAATPAASGKFSNSWKSFTGKANPSQPSAAGVATLARPDAATNPTTGDMATVALASPLQGTDPVSQRSVQIVRDLAPQPASAKRRPLWRQPRVLAAGAAGAIFLVLLGIWVIIRDKNGNEVARMKVPDGGRTEVVEGEVAPQKTDAPASPSVGAKAHTGQFGLQFDRDKKCLVTTEPLPHPTALPRTFEVWCKVDAAYEHAPGYLLRNYPWGALNVNGTYAGIKGFSFYTYHGEANTPVTPYPMGQRIHLAGVNDGRKRLLFLNGKLIAESADAGGLVTDAKDPLPIELGQNFTGELYAARLSSVARYTQDFEPPLEFKLDKDTELLFNFSEGQGDILRDSSGHNRHGKIVGAKWVRVGEVANAPATGNSQNKSALTPYEIFSSPDYEWTTPENLGPVVNSEDGEGTPFLAANGLTLYFDSGRPGGAGSNDLWFCRRLSLTAPWGAPENVGAPINTDTKEMGPSLSANELTLVFAREKTRNSGKFELWQATRDSLTSPWQTPVQLQSLGSAGAGFDDDPELSADGLTLLFHSNRNKGNREDLFFSRRASRGEPWPAAQNLGPVVNSWFREMSPALSSDGLVLVFSSDRDGGVGRTDLWFSLRTSSTAEWSEPRHLGRIANSAADDLCPALSADGQTLYFRSNRPGVLGKNNSPDLWMSRRVKKGTSKSTDGFTNTLGMEFVRVPKGKTWLGGGGGKAGTREVEFKEDYYLGKFEVTQDEWQRVRGKRSSSHFQRLGPGGDLIKDYSDADVQRLPVEMVNWNEAQEFIRLLNQKSPEAGWQYRLPTADEWEYACRGGPLAKKEDSAFHYYLAQPTDTLTKTLANISEGVPERTCPVGRYPANSLGLHDMHGNVYEWCDDKLLDKPETASRFAAGGSFANAGTTEFHRASYRAPNTPSRRSNNFGFRVARVRAETQTAWQSLFNGKDLTGWNKTNPKDTGTAEVVVEDGQPALQISGPYGIHSTVKTRDFHLRFDFKAEKETRGGVNFFAGAGMGIQARLDTLTRSTPALAFHVWGITCQESELRNGKFNPVGQTVGKDAYLDFTKFNLNTKSTWQRIEVVRLGDSMLFLVNGQVAGAVTNLRDAREPEAKAVDYSPIAIWSDLNGSAQFRKIEIREITTLPPGLFDQGTVR